MDVFHTKSLDKIDNLWKKAIYFVLHDYSSFYEEFVQKLNKETMNLARERLLCIKVFKTLSPCFMQELSLLLLRETNRHVRNKYK